MSKENNEITVVVEIPTGSRNKYEIDHESGEIWLDRYLFTSTQYPHDYGFVPNTLSNDGDPIDAFVLLEEPTFPGCHIKVRPVAILEMTDDAGHDEKLLCVPATDPRFANVQDIGDVDQHVLDKIKHFLQVYKDLEQDKFAVIGDWSDAQTARQSISEAIENFKNHN